MCRSLHWERGLKLFAACLARVQNGSLPSLGAWIETVTMKHKTIFQI